MTVYTTDMKSELGTNMGDVLLCVYLMRGYGDPLAPFKECFESSMRERSQSAEKAGISNRSAEGCAGQVHLVLIRSTRVLGSFLPFPRAKHLAPNSLLAMLSFGESTLKARHQGLTPYRTYNTVLTLTSLPAEPEIPDSLPRNKRDYRPRNTRHNGTHGRPLFVVGELCRKFQRSAPGGCG